MEPLTERGILRVSEDAEGAHHNSQERVLQDEEAGDDEEKVLLLGVGNGSNRQRSWESSWSTKFLALVTSLNVILFLISMMMLSLSRRKFLTDQDYWTATSYYCRSSPIS